MFEVYSFTDYLESEKIPFDIKIDMLDKSLVIIADGDEYHFDIESGDFLYCF